MSPFGTCPNACSKHFCRGKRSGLRDSFEELQVPASQTFSVPGFSSKRLKNEIWLCGGQKTTTITVSPQIKRLNLEQGMGKVLKPQDPRILGAHPNILAGPPLAARAGAAGRRLEIPKGICDESTPGPDNDECHHYTIKIILILLRKAALTKTVQTAILALPLAI